MQEYRNKRFYKESMSAFEFDGEKYNKASRHQKEWGSKIISELTLSGDERIFDLGCGDGILTAQLASLAPNGKVVGIDASKKMIAVAKKIKKHNLSFQVMDINQINFKNEFDLVFSNATLHWIKNHGRLLQKVFESLKPNGFIRFNFAGERNCSNFYKVIKEVTGEPRCSHYFKEFEWPWYMPKINDYEKLVKKSRFKEVKMWQENADRFFESSEEMIKWIDQPSIVPFLRCIDEKDKEQFRDVVVKRMIELTKQKDGTCFETFRRINVFARK